MLIKKSLTRRDILGRLGGSAACSALLPLIPRLEAAEADAGTIRRFSYWHEFTMPRSSITNAGYQTEAGPIQFREHNTPLNEVADKLIFLRKMRRPQGKTRTSGGPHPSGAHAITGWRGTTPGSRVYLKAATSLDQFLAKELAGKTPISDLRAGHRQGNDPVDQGTSVYKGSVQPRYQSPVAMYDDIFKNIKPGSNGGGNNSANSDLLRQRKSVLDYLRKDIAAVKKRVSHFDQMRIDAHNDSIRETEQKLEFQLGDNGSSGGDCSVSGGNIKAAENESEVYPAYASLVTQALACDLTRVAGMCFGPTTCSLRYAFLDSYSGNGAFHSATHGKSNSAAYIRDVLNFRAKSIAGFLKKMDAVQEPDGNSLLDNTIFACLNDVGRDHNVSDDIYCILAGGKGRFKNQGQMVNVGATDTYNQLQTSMAHFMGFEIDVHGDPNFGGTGVLSSDLFT